MHKSIMFRNIVSVSGIFLSVSLAACSSGSGSSGANGSSGVAYVLNDQTWNISRCPLDPDGNLNNCDLITPTDESGNNIMRTANSDGEPGTTAAGIVFNKQYAYIGIANNGSSSYNSYISVCSLGFNGELTSCKNVDTNVLFESATSRVSQTPILNNKIYFTSRSQAQAGIESNGYIVWCDLADNGSILSSTCKNINDKSNEPGNLVLFGNYGLTISNNHIYTISARNKLVSILTLDSAGNILADSLYLDHGLNANGVSVLESPRKMTIVNGYAYITDPGYNGTDDSLVVCQVNGENGHLYNCQPEYARDKYTDKNILLGPVGIGSYGNKVYPLNWGYNRDELGHTAGVCDLFSGKDTLSCITSYGYDSNMEGTFNIPMDMAVISANQIKLNSVKGVNKKSVPLLAPNKFMEAQLP
ncbi:hypothetical protein [Aquella oligotrophica]|uniref:DUF5050 domain-containing protein n=1 Tax=Aquella oligotrophica TaxID=2067065 RepID=A0A2I7N8L8_9NEIS|nr:hypothetical protein [Aquella oligotrophica]AUR52803.1 hypothetical protein CUN60_11030 [Aquella oligotrophica]